MAEIRINATGGVKLYDADDSHYAQIIAGTITANVDLLTLNSAGITVLDGAIDFDIASHDTSNGLKLGGTLVTATAAELNIMDGVTSTAAEINLIDGGTARGTTALADGDGILVNDAGTMRMTNVTAVKTYMGGGAALTGSTNNTVVTVTGSDAIAGEAKLLFDPPKLTIGNATAEDTLIVFDGNAQDWHIGLDDSEDDFTIGLGSTLGTTSHIVIDEAGAVTKPLQPAFLARPSSDQDNIATSTETDIAFATEVFDQNADFSTPSFTAPVTGKYQLSVNISVNDMDTAAAFYGLTIITSNRNYIGYTEVGPQDGNWMFIMSVLADMDASDTAKVSIYQSGGTQQMDIRTDSFFSGVLTC